MDLKLSLIFIIQFVSYTLSLDIRPSFIPPGKLPPQDVEDRIINGFTPNRFDTPYVVLLSIQFDQGGASCTGSLIHPNWVVTAGHCAKNARQITVFLGVYNRNEAATQTILVPSENIFVHPTFIANSVAIADDIALLRLNTRANIGSTIQTIPYPCPSTDTYAGRTGRVCGWGITSDSATSLPIVIQCVDMPVITNTECARTWGGYIRPTNVCTRVVNFRTTCSGDSGGPLVIVDGVSRRLKLIGCTSFGSKPCATTAPDAFTRIPLYNAWIVRISGVGCDSR